MHSGHRQKSTDFPKFQRLPDKTRAQIRECEFFYIAMLTHVLRSETPVSVSMSLSGTRQLYNASDEYEADRRRRLWFNGLKPTYCMHTIAPLVLHPPFLSRSTICLSPATLSLLMPALPARAALKCNRPQRSPSRLELGSLNPKP